MSTRGIAFLLLPVVFFLLSMIPLPLEDQVVPTVDLGAAIDEMGKDLTYKYNLIPGADLMKCEKEWEADVPYAVRDIIKLGGGNLLVVSRSNISQPGCEARGMKSEDEEVLSIYSPDGSLLSRRSLGARWVGPVYISRDGKLASLVTSGDDDEVQNIVIDQDGTEYFTAEGKIVLYPCPDGECLVCSAVCARPVPIRGSIICPNGQRHPIGGGPFINKDGSARIDTIAADFNEKPGRVLCVFDRKILFSWFRDTGGTERCNDLALYDIGSKTIVWQKKHYQISNQPAVCSSNAEDQFILLQYTNNEEAIRNLVISAYSGETVGRTTGGSIWDAVGSADGYFYANVSGQLRIGPKFRAFLAKLSPELRVIRFGIFYDGHELHEKKELNGYVWGIHEACTLGDVCYPVVTAVYDMRGDLPSGGNWDVLSTRVNPVLMEGFWFIDTLTDDKAVLIGQLDPHGGTLKKIVMDRAWIDREGR